LQRIWLYFTVFTLRKARKSVGSTKKMHWV
jgi:hypothetical protein